MNTEAAETLALQAFAWVAGDEALLGAFLAESGAAPADLRRRAGDPVFLASVLDFLLAEDGRVLAFAGAAGIPPLRVQEARARLPGGGEVHWT